MKIPYREILEIRSLKDDFKKNDILNKIIYNVYLNYICKIFKKSKRNIISIQKKDIYLFATFAMNIKDNRIDVSNIMDNFTIKFKKAKKMVIIETKLSTDEWLHITDKRDPEKEISFDLSQIDNTESYGKFCYDIIIDVIVDYMRGKEK